MITKIIGGNRLFTGLLVVSALLRLDAELGYRWQSWFNDSWDYVDTAVTLSLDPTRASGYSLYMAVLRPFHSFATVTVSQHLMGLATGVMIYALARRRFSCPAWLAALMAVPVLFDGFEIQLEHLIMSDTLFLFLTMLALVVLLWWPLGRDEPGLAWWKTSWARCAAAGVLISLSALVRATGIPLIPVFGLWILLVLALSRPGWKALVASVAAFGVTATAPIAAYAGWYDIQHGALNTSQSTGVFLYSRVMTFAECSKMGRLPVDLLPLCTTVPPSKRPIAQAYIWTPSTPLDRFPAPKWSPLPNSLAQQFAIRAIESQPLDYAKAAFYDTARTFLWPRTVFPNHSTYDEYLFGYHSVAIAPGHRAGHYDSSARAYLAGGNPLTQVVNPFAQVIREYQRYVYLPGTVYGMILLLGLGALVLGWRRREAGGQAGLAALLPWTTSAVLVVVPAATAEFDYRYVTTAVPFGCLALAMAYSAARGRLTRVPGGTGSGGTGSGGTGSGDTSSGDTAGAPGEAGGAAGLAGSLTGRGPGDGTAEAGHDQRDLAPDAS